MTRNLSPTVPSPEGADESRWFLHRLDAGAERGIYAETSRQRLRDAAFLDGRTRFWGREENRPLPQDKGDDLPPPRFIFHVSFCGSTMLARLLDAPGAVLSLKEPHAFVDLSNQAAGDGRAEPAAKFARLLSAEMSGMGTAGEQVVVKPSNWANSLIPTLCAAEAGATAIFMSMRLPLFLVAVLRGGRDRLTYTARAAAHLVSKSGLGSRALEMAVNEVSDPLTQAVRIAAVSHLVQENIFRTAMAARKWSDDHWLDFERFMATPGSAALQVASTLGLDVDEEEFIRRSAEQLEGHSKDQAREFSSAQRAKEDALIADLHGPMISDAVAWSRTLAI